MACEDCGAAYADCLTRDRVRICESCLYERTARERDEARVLLESLPTWGNYAWEQAAQSVASKLQENVHQIQKMHSELEEIRATNESLQQARRKAEAERDEARAEVTRLRVALEAKR